LAKFVTAPRVAETIAFADVEIQLVHATGAAVHITEDESCGARDRDRVVAVLVENEGLAAARAVDRAGVGDRDAVEALLASIAAAVVPPPLIVAPA
jgi:hypothetical protein